MIGKQKISTEEQWKSLVYDYLSKGLRGKSNFYELLRTSHFCEKSKTLKQYDIYESEYDLNLNKGKDDIILDTEKERLKLAILTKLERMKIASDLGRGKAWKVGDEVMIPTANDRLKALDYLSKVDGDYAAIKLDTEIKGANEIIVKRKSDN